MILEGVSLFFLQGDERLMGMNSSDLWTVGQVDGAIDTGLPASISYAKGDA